MQRDRWLKPVAIVVLSLALASAFFVVPYLPTTDGPEWIFATHAENHYSDPGAPYPDALIPTSQFASRGMSVVYGPFEAWLGWKRGLQVTLSLIALGSAWGFFALVHALCRERWAMGLFGFPLALSWELYAGLWPFVVASAFGLTILALAVAWREPTWRGRVALSSLLLAQAVAHVFGAVLTGGAILALWLARAPRGRRLAQAGYAMLVGLPAMLVLLASAWLSRDITRAGHVESFTRFPWRDVIAALPRTVAPGPLWRALIVCLGVTSAALLTIRRLWRGATSVDDRAFGSAALCLLALGALAPFQIAGWQFFSQRFVPLGVALVLAVVPLERLSGRARANASAVVFVTALAWLLSTYPFHRRLVALCPSALAGLDTSTRTNGELLFVNLRWTETDDYDDVRAEVPFANPLLHMGALYAVVIGGIPALSFTGVHAIHAFERRPSTRPLPSSAHYMELLRTAAFQHDPRVRREVLEELSTWGMYYDEVAVFGAMPGDFDAIHVRGFETDFRDRATELAHFAPCTIDVTLPPHDIAPPPSLDVSVDGIAVLRGAEASFVVGEGGLAHHVLRPAPCGDVSLRLSWPGGEHRCKNGGRGGALDAVVGHAGAVIACQTE